MSEKITFRKWRQLDAYTIAKMLREKSLDAWWDYVTALRRCDVGYSDLKDFYQGFLRGKMFGFADIDNFIIHIKLVKWNNQFRDKFINFHKSAPLHYLEHTVNGLRALFALDLAPKFRELVKKMISFCEDATEPNWQRFMEAYKEAQDLEAWHDILEEQEVTGNEKKEGNHV